MTHKVFGFLIGDSLACLKTLENAERLTNKISHSKYLARVIATCDPKSALQTLL